MMLMDMTTQLMPILYGLNVLLVISATALVANAFIRLPPSVGKSKTTS